MRSMSAIVLSIALLAAAWVADRLLVQAVSDYGTFGGADGTREGLLVIDRLGRVLVLAGIGVLTVLAARGRLTPPAAVGIGTIGGLASALPLLGFGLGIEALAGVAHATYASAQFVVWAGAGMLVAAVAAILAVGRSAGGRSIPALGRLALAAAILLVAMPLDAAVSSTATAASMRTGSPLVATLVDLGARVVVLAGLVALLWLSLGGRRDRAVGAAMAIGGFATFAGLALVGLLVTADPASTLRELPIVGYTTRWASGGIMLVGLWELVRQAAPRPAAPASAAVAAG